MWQPSSLTKTTNKRKQKINNNDPSALVAAVFPSSVLKKASGNIWCPGAEAIHLVDIRICKLYIKTFNNYCLISDRSIPIPEERCVYSFEDYGDYRQGYRVKTENITLGWESLERRDGGWGFFFPSIGYLLLIFVLDKGVYCNICVHNSIIIQQSSLAWIYLNVLCKKYWISSFVRKVSSCALT